MCTDDACDAKTGCTTTHNPAGCDDGDACTDKDTCAGGACAGSKITCDDKNTCTKDACDNAKGCVYTADDKLTCDDGKPCTVDLCKSGTCSSAAKVCPGHACASGLCDAKTGACGLKSAPKFSPCGDDRICISGQCRQPWATSVTSSAQFNCALKPDGKVVCWGSGKEGQLGNGVVGSGPPKAVGGVSGARSVQAGRGHVCANLVDGRTACWGRGTWGQLGGGTKVKAQGLAKFTLGAATATTVATGNNHSCMLRGGGAWCFGYNGSYQSARKLALNFTLPTAMVDVSDLDDLSIGSGFSCALRKGRVFCWGSNTYGETGRGYFNKHGHAEAVVGIDDATQVSAGAYHACALRQGGSVSCWGLGTYGRLGNGQVVNQPAPVTVTGLSSVVQVSAGVYHTCAVLDSGKGRCWGWNKYGQLGSGDTIDRSKPKAVFGSPGDIAMIDAGVFHTCALRRDGSLLCWGFSAVGELGVSQKGTLTKPVSMPNTKPAAPSGCKKDADCGPGGACFTWKCDGATSLCVSHLNEDGKGCDDGDKCTAATACKAGRCTGKAKCSDGSACTDDVCDPLSGKCNFAPNVALCDDGNACTTYDRCKGGSCGGPAKTCDDGNSCTTEVCDKKSGACTTKVAGEGAKCSDGSKCTTSDACKGGLCKSGGDAPPCPDDGNPCTLSVCDPSTGCQHVVAATGTPCGGQLICVSGACAMPWGTDVAVGREYSCALRPGGTVSCWGRNQLAQLGRNKLSDEEIDIAPVTGLNGVQHLDAGLYHACAIGADGKARCWGYNKWGQTGYGQAGGVAKVPITVPGPGDLVAVRAGYQHTCARRTAGELLCWGEGAWYQFNNNKNLPWLKATPIAQVPQMIDLASLNVTTCAVTGAGTVHCWGSNHSGTAGHGSSAKLVADKPVFGNLKAKRVVTGISHACALLVDGRVACWGSNKYGQLGNGGLSGSGVPGVVSLIDDATDITAGSDHSCVLRADGKVWCWGRNDLGQAGQKLLSPRRWPMPAGGPPMKALSAGYQHNCAIALDGSLYCWGSSKYGAIGQGKVSWKYVTFPYLLKSTKPTTAKSCQSNSDCANAGACYASACIKGTCTATPAKDGKGCDDGHACTTKDACQGAVCTGIAKCNDGNECTLDSCASDGACKQVNAVGWCDDGDNCTSKSFCAKGKCGGAKATVCDDKQACTVDSCNAKTGKCVFTPKAGCNAGSIISGTITFGWVPALDKSEGGPALGYSKGQNKPARRVEVLGLVNGAVVASARTDDKGNYALSVPAGASVHVRVNARLLSDGHAADGIAPDACKGARYDVRVVDNTNGKSLYAMQTPTGIKAPKSGVNMHAPLVWSAGKYVKRMGAPFTVLDTSLESIETMCQGNPKVKLPMMLFNWSVNNNPTKGDKTKGDMGSAAHFTTENGIPSVYLKGKENVDTDEYDDHTVAHEFGHYLERNLFRSDTIGGPHAFGQIVNPRTAFGEGYGNGLSAIVWADPQYVSTSGKNQKGGFVYDFSQQTKGDDRSVHSEAGVAAFLYHLWDGRDAKPNSGSFDRIYTVLSTCQVTTPALTSLHAFAGCYNSLFGGQAEGLKKLWQTRVDSPYDALCAGSCSGKGDVPDPWDVDNDLGKHYANKIAYPDNSGTLYDADFWRLYPLLKSGANPVTGHERTRRATYKGPFNKHGGARMYRYLGTGTKTTISLIKPVGATCTDNAVDMFIRKRSKVVASDWKSTGPTAGCPTATFAADSNTWYTVTVRLPSSKDAEKDLDGWQMVVQP